MTTVESRLPVAPGEAAPDFALPAVDRPETVSLADYRGRSALFLALLVGLWCPFCRRAIAHMATMESRLKAIGVETLCVVATTPENARLYFKFRPTRLRIASDPDLSTHRAYRLPKPEPTTFMRAIESTPTDLDGTLPEPMPVVQASRTLGKAEGYVHTLTDKAEMTQQFPQLKGLFLIDRDSVVRWAHIECVTDGPGGMGKLPSADEIVAAARTLPR